MSLSGRFGQRFALGVLALLVNVVIGIGIWLRSPSSEPPSVTTGDRMRGEVSGLRWSEAHVGFKHQTEIDEGNDLQIIVGAEALGRGRVVVEPLSSTVKISPAQLVIEVLEPRVIETGILVASQPKVGTREILVRATFIPESDPKQSGKPSSEAKGYVVDTYPITFRVIPKKTFGLTQGQLAAIQVFSGILGVPALLALVVKASLRKRSSSPQAG
jgi:hypothetical protein